MVGRDVPDFPLAVVDEEALVPGQHRGHHMARALPGSGGAHDDAVLVASEGEQPTLETPEHPAYRSFTVEQSGPPRIAEAAPRAQPERLGSRHETPCGRCKETCRNQKHRQPGKRRGVEHPAVGCAIASLPDEHRPGCVDLHAARQRKARSQRRMIAEQMRGELGGRNQPQDARPARRPDQPHRTRARRHRIAPH